MSGRRGQISMSRITVMVESGDKDETLKGVTIA
jgi:hypothetical protein